MSKKGDDTMITAPVEEGIIDRSQVLAPKQIKAYMEPVDGKGKAIITARHGRTEYNAGSILVKSKHPLDQCLRRGIIEGQHFDSGKRISTIRDCAFSKSHGRIYNDLGEGDSGIDAMTLYTNTYRLMLRNQWNLIKLICFAEPNIEGEYFNEMEYRGMYALAPNIQNAFEALDDALGKAREAIKDRISRAEKINGA